MHFNKSELNLMKTFIKLIILLPWEVSFFTGDALSFFHRAFLYILIDNHTLPKKAFLFI